MVDAGQVAHAVREFGLTDKQAVFVLAYIENPNATAAAKLAFPGAVGAQQIGSLYLKKPKIRNALRELTLGRAVGYSQECTDILMRIARDDDAPQGARIQAASRVLEIGGLLGPGRRVDSGPEGIDKPMSEMTVDELARAAAAQRERLEAALQVVEDLRSEAAAQSGALVIDAEPVVPDDADDAEVEPWE